MFYWRNVVLPLLLLCCVSCSSLKKDPSQEAKDIYTRSKESMKKISYKSTLVENKGKVKTTRTIYHRVNPDGTNDYRYESITEGNPPFTIITNKDGRFQLIGNAALKDYHESNRREVPEQEEQATYSLAEGVHRGLPCYIITRKKEPDEKQYNRYTERLPDDLKKDKSPEELKELFDKSFSVTEVCYIGKNDGFNYEYAYYNIHGKKTSMDYGDVELNPVLDDKVFKIPENFTVRSTKNQDEWIKIFMELHNKELEPMLKKIRQQRMIQEKLDRAANTSLVDRISRITKSFDIDKMKRYSASNTYLCDFLSLYSK
jgi:outer membrane lipoprotein-sorting protein